MSYEERIRHERSNMSKSFAKLADFLLDSYIQSAFMTASELAHELDLDAATVVRFAQTLGYTGFPELQREIRQRVLRDLLVHPEEAKVVESVPGVVANAMAELSLALEQTRTKKPNIVVLMGDDIGWSNIGVYNQGIMAGRTPNLDRMAAEGMRFTDYYAEASCTAGRANFITGELPIRTGLTTVGQAGATLGMPDAAPTIATALKSMGYATGQFGKNHFGDLNQFLPTVHGFDEFYGYLYHLDAMEDPCHVNYPPAARETVGPRNMIHSWASTTDDPTVMPRWGQIVKQKIEDDGPLPPHPTEGVKLNMETVDDVFLKSCTDFMDKAKKDGEPFFVWHNTTRMHVFTFLSDKYKAMMTREFARGQRLSWAPRLERNT